jgi:hypothetical protein
VADEIADCAKAELGEAGTHGRTNARKRLDAGLEDIGMGSATRARPLRWWFPAGEADRQPGLCEHA